MWWWMCLGFSVKFCASMTSHILFQISYFQAFVSFISISEGCFFFFCHGVVSPRIEGHSSTLKAPLSMDIVNRLHWNPFYDSVYFVKIWENCERALREMRKEKGSKEEKGIVLKKRKGKERNLPPLFWGKKKKDLFCKVTILYDVCCS